MSLKTGSLIAEQDFSAGPRIDCALAIAHAGGSITCLQRGPGGRISLRMNRRLWVLGLCIIVVAAAILLVPSLGGLRFEPARSFASPWNPARPIVLPSLNIAEDTPLWNILLFWLALVVNLALFFLLLPPELRKRILRQLIGFAVGVLAFVLALRYRLVQWPETILEAPAGGPSGITAPASADEVQAFQPPQMPPWMTFAIALVLLWLILLAAYFLYRFWQRYRMRRVSTLGAIADIARTSLADLAAGRHWGDVVVEAYARMNDALQVTRGLQRESSSTPREFAARLARTGLPAGSVEELTRLFESVRYGGHASDEGAGRRAAACLESILSACGVTA